MNQVLQVILLLKNIGQIENKLQIQKSTTVWDVAKIKDIYNFCINKNINYNEYENFLDLCDKIINEKKYNRFTEIIVN